MTQAQNLANLSQAFTAGALAPPNLIINPHGSIQQETTTPVTGPAYCADQWTAFFAASGGAASIGVATDGSVSAFDLGHLYQKCTTAKGALAAGDELSLTQLIEGLYARRLKYGTANAKGSWLRFRVSGSQAGTAAFSIRNGNTNRSYVKEFPVSTTPTDLYYFIPGDTTGTWATDTSIGARVTFAAAIGSTYATATLGAWQAGNFIGSTTQSNGLDTVNRQLNITDVAWVEGPVLLPFTPTEYPNELRRCQRYYWKEVPGSANYGFTANGFAYTTSNTALNVKHPVQMRAAPTLTVNNVGCAIANGSNVAASSVAGTATTPYSSGLNLNMSASTFTVGQGTNLVAMTSGAYIEANARL